MTRTINAPGFELNEIDRSQYDNTVDYSLANAPVSLVLGYSDYGAEYVPQIINTRKTYLQKFGYPTSDIERYMYGAVEEILNKRGICIAAKVPYDNKQKQHYAYTTYTLDCDKNNKPITKNIEDDKYLTTILCSDSSIKTYFDIKSTDLSDSGKMSFDDFEKLLVGKTYVDKNTLKIVDISHQKYSSTTFNCISDIVDQTYTNDCLGIVPILVSPVNALYFKQILTTDCDIDGFNNVTAMNICNSDYLIHQEEGKEVGILKADLTDIESNCYIPFSTSDDEYSVSLSQKTSQLFPEIKWKDTDHLKRDTFKCIGIVVLKAYTDNANDGKINFSILESFVGTLSRNLAQESTIYKYICDEVNEKSNYIRVFGNFDELETIDDSSITKNILNTVDILNIRNQTATSLGFFNRECTKNFGTTDFIYDSVKKILAKLTNVNSFPIDIVVDAGMTNIIQYVHWKNEQKETRKQWTLETIDDTKDWYRLQTLFDNFCRNQRKDCMFICDCLRTLCLYGNQKIVRNYAFTSIENDIVPKLKLVRHIDSSYTAGYCNWYKVQDSTNSNVYYWQPPSIKAAGVYTYCNTYCHIWDAPAGTDRGKLTGVIDVAFNPSQSEAGKFYENCWNFSINYPAYGTVIEGQKTFQTDTTALDRINVRRLVLWLERQVMNISKQYLYLINTTAIRTKLLNALHVPFQEAKNGLGISDYAIVCDSSNNTDKDVENGQLNIKIAIKPIKSIEFIILDFIVTNQSMSISEEIQK